MCGLNWGGVRVCGLNWGSVRVCGLNWGSVRVCGLNCSFPQQDEFSSVVEKWNAQRALTVSLAIQKVLFPIMEKELRQTLVQEAKEHVLRVRGWGQGEGRGGARMR